MHGSLLIRYAGFRWLWLGQFLSQMGNAIFLIMGLWEIQLKSPFLLSVAGLAMTLPLSFAVVGGTVVDRYDPRRVMLWTDLLRGVAVALGLVALALTPAALIPAVIVLLAVNSLGASLFSPAEGVVVPWLVEGTDLPAANGLYSLTNLLSQAIGSAIGGAAIAAIGITVVFGLDMGSFWLSALAIVLMMRAARPTRAASASTHAEEQPTGMLHNLMVGWRGLGEMPWLLRLIPPILGTNFAFSAAFTMLPYWIRHDLHTGALGFGLIDGAWALGMVTGSITVGVFRRGSVRSVTAGLAGVLGALSLGFAASSSPWLSGVLLCAAGGASGILNAMTLTIMQRTIPEAIRGRALGLFFSLATLANPTGALVAGLALPVLPLWWSWLLGGLSTLALALFAWRSLPEEIPAGGASLDPTT